MSVGLYSCPKWGRVGGVWDAGKGIEKQFSVKGGRKEAGREGRRRKKEEVLASLLRGSEANTGDALRPWKETLAPPPQTLM